jgi:hypothetical protein
MTSFTEIETAINEVPVTYLPALLITVVQRCEREGVFAPGGLEKIVASAKDRVDPRQKR